MHFIPSLSHVKILAKAGCGNCVTIRIQRCKRASTKTCESAQSVNLITGNQILQPANENLSTGFPITRIFLRRPQALLRAVNTFLYTNTQACTRARTRAYLANALEVLNWRE